MPRSPTETIRFLTLDETARLFRAIGPHRRDRALFVIAYRHGLRASEVGLLRVEDVDLKTLRIMVHRLKDSHSGAHPLQADEAKALKALLRERQAASPILFPSSRGDPIARRTLDWLTKTERKAGEILARMAKSAGAAGSPGPGRGHKTDGNHCRTFSEYGQALEDNKISERSARRWQELAEVSQEQFDAAPTTAPTGSKERDPGWGAAMDPPGRGSARGGASGATRTVRPSPWLSAAGDRRGDLPVGKRCPFASHHEPSAA